MVYHGVEWTENICFFLPNDKYHLSYSWKNAMMGQLKLSIYFLLVSPIVGLIHHLVIKDDSRPLFEIETFGFYVGGSLNITIRDFSIQHDKKGVANHRIGLLLRSASSENEAQKELETIVEQGGCIFDKKREDDIFMDLSDTSEWKKISTYHTISPGSAGLYSLIFARCAPSGSSHKVNFVMDAIFVNPGPSYLSAGEAPLPKMYMALFAVYSAALWLWCWVICRRDGHKAHYIHHLMGGLMAVKCLSLLLEAIRFHFIAQTGSSEGWSIIYYIFASLKGTMIFVVILLIGSGWSLVKPFLHSREKNIVVGVLSLQVINDIAMVIIEETSPGSVGWMTWRDLLHLVDMVCCIAILYPIFWSINHFRQAAEADGKARDNLQKLQLFRQFYVLVLCYIYFTRVIVFLITATVGRVVSCGIPSILPATCFDLRSLHRCRSMCSGWGSCVWSWARYSSSLSRAISSNLRTTMLT